VNEPLYENVFSEEMQKRLIEQYTEIARLAGGLAHEIKNPLSTIRLNMELLAEDLSEAEDSPTNRRALKKIGVVQRECGRLEETLNEFLNFARAHRLELEPSDLNEFLTEVLEFYRPKAKEAEIEIVKYFAADLPTVPLDKNSFRRAFLNLVINAEQAMPEGGRLVVRTRPAENGVAIDLIDDGRGIDAVTQQRIFEPFFSTKSGGSGLGLPTVRKVIEAHKGEILLESEQGFGTQFTIKLPGLVRLPSE